MAKRSGTEKRQRMTSITFRCTPDEKADILAKADRSAISVAALIRHALFNTPPPRAARKPTVEVKAITRLLAELGKIGGNINQAVKHINAGHPQWNVLQEAVRTLLELRTACLQALGMEPWATPDTGDDEA